MARPVVICPFQYCVCTWYVPLTPLAPITPTLNPNVTLNVTHHKVHTHRCTPTHKVLTFGSVPALLRGHQKAREAQCTRSSVCGSHICFISVSSGWLFIRLYIWPSSSSQAKLPRCPLGSLELWEAQRGSGKVVTPNDLQLSPEGTGVWVSQWEWCHISVQTRRLTNVTAAATSDGGADDYARL